MILGCEIAKAQTQSVPDKDPCDQYKKSDSELNKVFQQILREYKGDIQFIRKLKASQRAWLAYRDAQLLALFPKPDALREYGSAFRMCSCLTLDELTNERVKILRRWIEGTEEGDVCSGSIRLKK
jgi:uncharacterized protein YecT (DUF1311 family)